MSTACTNIFIIVYHRYFRKPFPVDSVKESNALCQAFVIVVPSVIFAFAEYSHHFCKVVRLVGRQLDIRTL